MTNPADSSARTIMFPSAFVDGAWADRVAVTIRGDQIAGIQVNADRSAADEVVDGVAIPGMINVHSHAFQRAMAGLSEYRTGEHDSFWTWRQLMYECATRWSPEDVYGIALGLYRELRDNGYTWVGEFQYLHNDKQGRHYSDRAAMSRAVIQAAQDAGIGICILPVLYQRAGMDGGELDPAQQRFVLDDDAFWQLVQQLRSEWAGSRDVRVGVAFHSLRAVSIDVIRRVAEEVRKQDPAMPIHIHVAEQTREVADCMAAFGRRPVEYLMSEVTVDEAWCLIHATHVNEREISSIVESGAVVGLCPSTEANLGDGIFPVARFLAAGGRIAIGSDSHVSVSPRSELRLLEYAQRLTMRKRAILGTESLSVGRRLVEAASHGGAAALGIPAGQIAIGARADWTVVDPAHAVIQFAAGDRLLDRFVFCDAGNPVMATVCGGKLRP